MIDKNRPIFSSKNVERVKITASVQMVDPAAGRVVMIAPDVGLRSVCLFVCLSVWLSAGWSVCLSVCLPVCLSIYFHDICFFECIIPPHDRFFILISLCHFDSSLSRLSLEEFFKSSLFYFLSKEQNHSHIRWNRFLWKKIEEVSNCMIFYVKLRFYFWFFFNFSENFPLTESFL